MSRSAFQKTLLICLFASIFSSQGQLAAFAAEPRVLVEGCKLELIAKEPEIVTPIGMAMDAKGRLLVIESHTHMRPKDYKGPAGDRIRMLSDSNGDGRLDEWSTFAEGYQQAMNLCVRPDGAVYLVTRRDVRLLRDTNDDGVADKDETLIKLETEDDYPHNGLAGIAFHPGRKGGVAFLGLGENHGFHYKLTGSDGRTLEGVDGSGTIFACDERGSNIIRWSEGFWNPFSLCDAGDELYCVDNDPDSSPPCRLIQVQPGGDYGYRYQYGRAGTHPLQAWNGELPGTLPMLCGVGEAPTGLIAHRGWLWVTSWGDHRLERYEVTPGNEPIAHRTVVVQGGADFRPTGVAAAKDGSLFFSDWVDRSYPVHSKGRIWRLTLPAEQHAPMEAAVREKAMFDLPSPSVSDKKQQISVADWDKLQALERLDRLHELKSNQDIAIASEPLEEVLRCAVQDKDANVRLMAIRCIADDRMTALRDDVAKLLDGPMPTERYFLAVLGAIDWLDGDASMRSASISDELLVRELQNEKRSPELHALALRLISPNHKWLTVERLKGYLKSQSNALRTEAVRTIVMRSDPQSIALLADVAANPGESPDIRADAVAGLAAAAEQYAAVFEKLSRDENKSVAAEANRVLRLSRSQLPIDEKKPAADDLPTWNKLLGEGGDAAAGRRLFFMAAGPRCANCHQSGGRGGRIGPDLSHIGRQQSRERIISSILQPSHEIAPDYQPWRLLTSEGVTRVGLRLPKPGDDGKEIYADSAGKQFELKSEDIELREPSDKSIMPDGLEKTLSVEDLRDLIAFLSFPQ